MTHPDETFRLIAETRAFAATRQEEWRALMQALIRFDSRFESERGVVEFVRRRLLSLGVPVDTIPHDPSAMRELASAQGPISPIEGRGSLVARLPGRGGGRSLALNTHLDVVPPGDPDLWSHPPFSGHFDDARRVVFGRGAMDDKAGVTISLAVLESLLDLRVGLKGDVVFQYVLEDETTGNGSLLCLEAGHRTDGVMIIDGTRRDRAINQHAGQLQFSVTVRGKAAPVSVSHLGENAAELLARLLIRLKDAIQGLNATRIDPWTRFPSPYQLVIQSLRSDGEQNTVPDVATAGCWVTFPPPGTLATIRELLRHETASFAAAASMAAPPGLDWTGFSAEPVRSPGDALEVVLQRSILDVGMTPVEVGPSTGTSDLRHYVHRGIPGLLYGPGRGFNPHRSDEHYFVDDLQTMVPFYVMFVARWCGLADA
jgi:acetylornithine deacetylase